LALSTLHFKKVNGWSNQFWGWGGEDDEMALRIRYTPQYPEHQVCAYVEQRGHG
jgi:predicted glycosyltransferase involved in capsule biosynthesis